MKQNLTKEDLNKIKGGKATAAQCSYWFAMCQYYPHGCTNPCKI